MAVTKRMKPKDLEDLNALLVDKGSNKQCSDETGVPYPSLNRIKALGRGEPKNIDPLINWVRKNRKLLTDQKQTA